jgi:uncharacterized phage protein gp47/JayE
MASVEANKVFVPETSQEWLDAFLADIRLEARKAMTGTEPAVQPGTDDYRFAVAVANAAFLQASSLAITRSSVTPLNATGDDLEEWRAALGLAKVKPSPSAGKVILSVNGTGAMPVGTQFVFPNGLRGKVAISYPAVSDESEVEAVAIDTGTATNFPTGTVVRFVSPPLNINTEAKVSRNAPMTGGLDEESEERKRARILNRLQNKPAGGNWAHMREKALDELASLQDCYVYPALGGPSSVKVVPVFDFDVDNHDYSRAPDVAALDIVRNALYREFADQDEIVVNAPVDQSVDVGIKVSIPLSVAAGGDGTGWLDAAPWPPLEGGDNGRVTVTTVNNTTQIIVSAISATSPIAGQTHISWWSPDDRKFRTYLVTGIGGSAGAWLLQLDAPLVSQNGVSVAVGDFVSPAAVNTERYGKSWIEYMRSLGPGENTSDANRLPRALRHPYVTDEDPTDVGFLALKQIANAHAEITHAEFGYRSVTTPTVPASVDTGPSVLVPRHLGVYRYV